MDEKVVIEVFNTEDEALAFEKGIETAMCPGITTELYLNQYDKFVVEVTYVRQ
jgi:hypothetical protein